MHRAASLVVLSCGAAGCWEVGRQMQVQVIGTVEIAPGCANGVDRFRVDLESGDQTQGVTLHCADSGAFTLSFIGGITSTLTITAAGCGDDEVGELVLGKRMMPVDTRSGFADVGVIQLELAPCP
jgi:hypothetical protein